MSRQLLSESQKKYIVYCYTELDMSQDDIARRYSVSRRTIQRALIEKGVPPKFKRRRPALSAPASPEDSSEPAPTPPVQLEMKLVTPSVNRENVRQYIRALPTVPFTDVVQDFVRVAQRKVPDAFTTT